MKRLAFIFIALFSLNIAYVFSQESQESQESSSFRSGGGSGSSIDDFFPIWGITLGRTTWSQAQGEGFNVEMYESGPGFQGFGHPSNLYQEGRKQYQGSGRIFRRPKDIQYKA